MVSFVVRVILSLLLALVDGLFVWWLNPYGLDFSDSFLTAFLLTTVVGSALVLHDISKDV